MLSTVLILPSNFVATGNAVSEAMGWGPNAYSVTLAADGSGTATHYGLHTWASAAFRQMIETAFYPPELADAGISQASFAAMSAVLIYSFWPDHIGHFATVIAENGLSAVAGEI